jgi:hypothetical protein
MLPCNLPNSTNLSLPNIKYLWFLLPFFKIWLLPDNEKSTKLTIQEIVFKGTIIAIIITIPSLVAFVLTWVFLDDVILGAFSGMVVNLIALVFSWKISKKLLIKK